MPAWFAIVSVSQGTRPVIVTMGTNPVKKYLVTFKDEFSAETEEDAYDQLLKYLAEMVRYEDVVAFNFKEIGK